MANLAPGVGVLRIVVSRDDGRCVVHVFGDIDLHTAPRLRTHLMSLVERGEPYIVLDLGAGRMVDSTGLGVLVAVMKRVEATGGTLVLRSPRSAVRRALDITGLDRVFTVVA